MSKKQSWVMCPVTWIHDGKLSGFEWGCDGTGAKNIAALMCLTAIAHSVDRETELAQLTYDDFMEITGRSRSSISGGLSVLIEQGLIERASGRSRFKLLNYDPQAGWAKLPWKRMYYQSTGIAMFRGMYLRQRAELDALKLFFLFVERRDRKDNMAKISYDKIIERTGISRRFIRPALSLLVTHGLLVVNSLERGGIEAGSFNAYELLGIEPNPHGGSTKKGIDLSSFGNSSTSLDQDSDI